MNYCTECGTKLAPGVTACAHCGATFTAEQVAEADAVATPQSNGSPVSLVLGILSILGGSFFALIGVILALVGIFLGSKNVDRGGSKLGLTLSIFGMIYSIVIYLIYSAVINNIVFPAILAASGS